MNILKPLTAAVALAVGSLAVPAWAQEVVTADFDVLLTIESTCVFGTPDATDIDFGAHASTVTDIEATGTLSVLCTLGTPFEIALDSGENGADVSSRAMSNDDGVLVPYQLYQDTARTVIWGDTAGTDTFEVPDGGTGEAESYTVYGLVPSANFPAGDYSDTVTVTVTW